MCVAAPGALDVHDMAGANAQALASAIAAARDTLNAPDESRRNTTIVLKFPAGTADFASGAATADAARVVIDVSTLHPGPHGRLIIAGAGPAATLFRFSPDQVQILGRDTNRFSLIGVHMDVPELGATQGHVVRPADGSVPDNVVAVDIDPGYPGFEPYPAGLYSETAPGNGRYLRKYVSDSTVCHLDFASPIRLVPFVAVRAAPGHPGRWLLTLLMRRNSRFTENPFADGDLVGIKSGAGGGTPYRFLGGSDIDFDHVLWTGRSRGVFRGGANFIHITDSAIRVPAPRNGHPACLSSSGGGPQIGQPDDVPTWGNVIDGFHAENTGDDSIAVFNSHDPTGRLGTRISNSFITDSFARGILLYHSPVPPNALEGNTIKYCEPAACVLQK
jgi:hypothetical protein